MRDSAALGGSQPSTVASLATFQGHSFGSPEEAAGQNERERIANAQEPLVDRIFDLHAVTLEGHAARARSYALWDGELMKPQDDIMALFTQAIVRDLLAGKRVA